MNEDDRAEQFIQLLAENERRLAVYVMTFVPRSADADDILQETKLALWRSFDQFETGTNFGAWARRAAFNRILDFRKRKGRENKRLVFSDGCLQHLAEHFEQSIDRRETEMERLSDCVSKLSSTHRRIVTLRYGEEQNVDQIARHIDRTVSATYRVLSRIRLALRDCVRSGESFTTPSPESAR